MGDSSAGFHARVDPHVKILSESIVERAKRRGLDALVYAPHFTRLPDIEREAERYSDDELLIVPGREVFTGAWGNRRHVLALGLDEPVPDFIPLNTAMAEFRRQNATVLVPHPEFFTVGLTAADCRRYRGTIDAIEVYNPKHRAKHTDAAKRLADELAIPAFGSSYAHLPWTVGDVWTELDREITDEPDLLDGLVEGRQRVCRLDGIGPSVRSTAEFAHLGWENSWKKFDRVVRSGMEPTHPRYEAYEGRFEDVSVY